MYKGIFSGVTALVLHLQLNTGEDGDKQDRGRERGEEEKVIQLKQNFHTSLEKKSLCVFNSIVFSYSHAETLAECTEAQLSALCHLTG